MPKVFVGVWLGFCLGFFFGGVVVVGFFYLSKHSALKNKKASVCFTRNDMKQQLTTMHFLLTGIPGYKKRV